MRGVGLLQGIELVSNRATKQPAAQQTAQVLQRARELGLLLGRGGRHGNVLRITPPMCITGEDVDFLCDALDISLRDL